jgi:hypothetical protein
VVIEILWLKAYYVLCIGISEGSCLREPGVSSIAKPVALVVKVLPLVRDGYPEQLARENNAYGTSNIIESMNNLDKQMLAEDRVLAELVRRLVEAFQPERIFLFGSRARGEAGPNMIMTCLF